jgi:hypothetical protein
VVLRHLDDARIPARPIAAGLPRGVGEDAMPPTLGLGLFALLESGQGGIDVVRYLNEQMGVPRCPEGVPTRELPRDCHERAPTPGELFAKLDEWGHEALVIPHGTTWGYYTPLGSSWDKQLDPAQHDPERQTLVEVFSGHGNSEEFRSWREVTLHEDGSRSCPEPTGGYLPSCWRAGEIILERCAAAGEAPEECQARAAEARQNYVEADLSGHLTVPGSTGRDWGGSGQCRDCFLPAFNHRPRSSVQYMLALGGFDVDPDGSRTAFFGLLETERQASFFLTGGLVAVHAAGRGRDAVWEALQRKEVYGTSGPRILLWFDLVHAPGGGRLPMGSALSMDTTPTFEVRAIGSLEQAPGCPDFASAALSPERLERLCAGECYHPLDRRRRIARIEVVRIRPQAAPGEPVEDLIEDPWKVLSCPPDPAGCRVRFADPYFSADGRDSLYYVRAIEESSLAVDHDGVECLGTPFEDDCLGEVEERAWSSPIFVDWAGD